MMRVIEQIITLLQLILIFLGLGIMAWIAYLVFGKKYTLGMAVNGIKEKLPEIAKNPENIQKIITDDWNKSAVTLYAGVQQNEQK